MVKPKERFHGDIFEGWLNKKELKQMEKVNMIRINDMKGNLVFTFKKVTGGS